MRKSQLIIVSGAVLVSTALVPAGAASAELTGLADLLLAAGPDDLPAFAGYEVASADGQASVVITLPDATECDEVEITGAATFMGDGPAAAYLYSLVGAKCEPGVEPAYVAVIQRAGGSTPYQGPLAAGDKIKLTITDDGEETTARLENLSGGGTPIEVTVASVPFDYEVGTTSLGAGLIGGEMGFAKNRVDGAKLKAAGPTKVSYDDGTRVFKPTRLKKGQNFTVKSS